MSELKHTPGPWESFKGNIYGKGMQRISSVTNFGNNQDANAKLIAAAPEMLEALHKFKQDFEEKGEAKDTDFYYCFCELISKATE